MYQNKRDSDESDGNGNKNGGANGSSSLESATVSPYQKEGGDKRENHQHHSLQRQVPFHDHSSSYIARPTFGLIDFAMLQTLGTSSRL